MSGIIEYRQEINLQDMVDEIAKRIQRNVDAAALDKSADTLAKFGYVKVVRCSDCKWAKPEQSDHEYRGEYHCNMWIADVSADGFCFRAKRRDDK